ncbi:hypothetical protein DFH05DRAFT_1384208, partial [Lentinula detonsa]
ITLPASKTNPFHKGITVVIAAAPGHPTCAALQSAGYEQSKFSGHSFRHGAATSAFAPSCSEYESQLLGCWRSNAFKLYIE